MSLFSARYNFKPTRVEIQVESIDEKLDIHLWNAIYLHTFDKLVSGQINSEFNDKTIEAFLHRLWTDFFNNPIDQIPRYKDQYSEFLKKKYIGLKWYEKYDLLDFFVNSKINHGLVMAYKEYCNYYLEKELSAYRIVEKQLVSITDKIEIKEIETALNDQNLSKSIQSHLKRALELMSDRTNPDYRNSIKESISAVEALCIEITGNSKATLGQALKQIEKTTDLHKSLQSAFGSLYGYTSEADGIRHAMLEESTIKQEDAIFMLVSCSAFVNYLKLKR